MCKYNIEKLLCRCPYYFSFFQLFSMFKETFITSQLFFLSLRGFSTLIRKAEQKIWLKYICKGTLFLFTYFLVLSDAISWWNNIYWNLTEKGKEKSHDESLQLITLITHSIQTIWEVWKNIWTCFFSFSLHNKAFLWN